MISFCCQSCGRTMKVQDDFAGRKGKCVACGQPTQVPAASDLSTLSPAQRESLPDCRTQPPPASGPEPGPLARLAPPEGPGELGRLGPYRVLEVLGKGGMGVVYKAEDPRLRRAVALKALLPAMAASGSAGKRFLREAQAMAAVKHDHIVTIYQVDEARGVPFLAMELLVGETLEERVEREGKLPTAEMLRIGREMAEGLAAAHATGLIHRDIKPANVWLESPRDRVKILDFGLARATSQEGCGLTQVGDIMGTPAYMAPEQARGEAVDARCDLFSLGVVLYRLCTGRLPFKGKDSVSTLVAVATLEPLPPRQLDPEVPPGVSEMVMGLLEKDPGKRPASAREVAAILQRLERKPVRQDATPAPTGAVAVEVVVVPATARPVQAEKTCPWCAEPIKSEARKCKHCGEILDPLLRAAQESERSRVQPVVIHAERGRMKKGKERSPSNIGLGFRLLVLIAAGVVAIWFMLAYRKQARALNEGTRLYEEGKIEEAIAHYKFGYPVAAEQKGIILRRIVQHEIKQGDMAEARLWIDRGLEENVDAAYTEPAAVKLLAQAMAERVERLAREKLEKEQQGEQQAEKQEAVPAPPSAPKILGKGLMDLGEKQRREKEEQEKREKQKREGPPASP